MRDPAPDSRGLSFKLSLGAAKGESQALLEAASRTLLLPDRGWLAVNSHATNCAASSFEGMVSKKKLKELTVQVRSDAEQVVLSDEVAQASLRRLFRRLLAGPSSLANRLRTGLTGAGRRLCRKCDGVRVPLSEAPEVERARGEGLTALPRFVIPRAARTVIATPTACVATFIAFCTLTVERHLLQIGTGGLAHRALGIMPGERCREGRRKVINKK